MGQQSRISIDHYDHVVKKGTVSHIKLSREAATARFIVYKNGKVFEDLRFENVGEMDIPFSATGDFGIEVWIAGNAEERPTLARIYVKVTD